MPAVIDDADCTCLRVFLTDLKGTNSGRIHCTAGYAQHGREGSSAVN